MATLTGTAYLGDVTTRSTTPLNAIGTKAVDTDGNTWRYIKAGANIAQYDAVRFQGSALGWDDVRPTSAVAQPIVGVAQAAFTSGDYGFVLVNGVGSMKTTGTLAANVQVVSNATAGTGAAYANTDITSPVVTVLVSSASPQVVKIGLD